MLQQHKVVINFGQALFINFDKLHLLSLIFDRQLFVESDHFLYGVPPPFEIAAFLTLAFVSDVSKTFFKDIVPVTKVLWRDSFKVLGSSVVIILSVLRPFKEQVKYMATWVDSILILDFCYRHTIGV